MANLVCWSSGLLEVLTNNDTPLENGPIILKSGVFTAMNQLKTAYGEPRKHESGQVLWYVPRTRSLPRDAEEAGAVQRENMKWVIHFMNRMQERA